jgi:hypothetical protein
MSAWGDQEGRTERLEIWNLELRGALIGGRKVARIEVDLVG